MKIEQGQLWEVVTDNFWTSGNDNKYKRPVKLKKHEIIEIRYAYAWHFRTEDNYYFHATEKMILDNCNLFGVILGDVRFNNRAKLEEILRLELYKGDNFYQLKERREKE